MFLSQHEMHTSIPVHDYKFSWTIESFHLSPFMTIRGPGFCPIPGDKEKFRFEVEFRRDGNKSSLGYLDFRIINVVNNMQHNCLRSCGEVKIKNKEKTLSKLLTFNLANIKPFATLYSFTKLSFPGYNPFGNNVNILLNESNFGYFGLSGTITLEGTLNLFGHNIKSTIYSTLPESNCEELQRDLKSMLESGTGSDVTFTIGDKTLRAHKNILVARSEVFARMFQHDMLENRTNSVALEDVDYDTFKRFLVYLYTGNLELAEGDCSKALISLYSVAQKYQIQGLRKICLARLTKELSVGSVCGDLVLADLHGDEEFKGILKIFLRENFISVAGTTAWVEIVVSKPTLMQEVLDFVKPAKNNP